MIKKILISSIVASLLGLASSQYTNDTFDQKLDHFDDKVTTTFKMRYFQNDTFWDSKAQTGPVFLYICGEYTCQPPSLRGRDFPFQVCQEMGCLFYALEHRYYGESQPYSDWSTDNLKYLNTTQALADIDYFISNRNSALDDKYGKATRKWITIGGSYPGALSAWFKNQYPTSVVGAWSSSGVINAIQNFDMFDKDIGDAALRSGQNCVDAIKNFTTFIENAVTGKSSQSDLGIVHSVFNNSGIDNGDFMFFIADIFTEGVQYGGRSELCNLISSINGNSMSLQLPVLKQYADAKGVTLDGYDRKTLQNTTIDSQKAGRQWTWQYCTEFGWFQVPYEANPMRSSLINSTYWIPMCQAIFGDSLTGPAVDYYNKKFGGLNITGSNILFVNAIEDPWQYAGMRELQTPTGDQKDMVAYLVDCNNCGHCVDLYTPQDADTPILKLTRKKIKAKITSWLTAEKEEGPVILSNGEFKQFLQ